MSVARMQRMGLLALMAVISTWVVVGWNYVSVPFLILGALVVLLGHAGFLALEFGLLSIHGVDPRGRPPTRAQFLRAWAGEVVHAARVFGWRQPWRSHAVDDWVPHASRTGVVLVHGFFCNRGFWNPWMACLRAAEIPYVAVNLEPPFGSIDAYAESIDAAVRRVQEATTRPPVVVAHSMGGLAVRSWLARSDAADRVQRVFTLGTPHGGTWLARFSSTLNGRQMRIGSPWLDALSNVEATRNKNSLFVCYYSNCDNIVFPASLATLPGAESRCVEGLAHVHLAFEPPVMGEIVREIEATEPLPARTRAHALSG